MREKVGEERFENIPVTGENARRRYRQQQLLEESETMEREVGPPPGFFNAPPDEPTAEDQQEPQEAQPQPQAFQPGPPPAAP